MTNPINVADAFLPNFDRAQDKMRLCLSYCLCGFSRDESIDLAGISRRTLYHWRQKDHRFEEIELKSLPELRKTFTKEIVFWEYMRNLRLTMALDEKLLQKAFVEPEGLSRREWAQLKSIRSGYSNKQLHVVSRPIEGLGIAFAKDNSLD